jgi:3',5'-cyclic AMP phosphodiesterase CpdA
VIHHHLVPIPGTGRERNIITDAGDLLALLNQLDIDIVLSGHKHVPFFWGLNGILICNSSTAATRRVRGLTPSSWNELHVDASTVKVYTHYADGRRELSVIFSRKTRAMTREAFYLTDAFLESNHLALMA